MTQQVGVKVKTCGLLAIYLNLLLIALHQQYTHAYFEGCDNVYTITTGLTYLRSPYYPNYYPARTSCRYQIIAPQDHDILIDCTLNMKTTPTACNYGRFYISIYGALPINQMEQFCDNIRIQRISKFRQATFAYISTGQTGRFQCSLTARPQPCDCGWSVNTKIKGGQPTSINEYPSMVALAERGANQDSFCGGTIINHRYILTAAHCFDSDRPINLLIVLAGDQNLATTGETPYEATYNVDSVIKHPLYNAETNVNDIALVRTNTDIEWSRGVGPICLPFSYNNPPPNFENQLVDVLGWGTTSFAGIPSPVLQKLNQRIVSNAVCQAEYRNIQVINNAQICTNDYTNRFADTCQYDSGGPVFLQGQRQYLIGIISYGFGCGAKINSTSVNTRITSYLNWIQSQVGNSGLCKRLLK